MIATGQVSDSVLGMAVLAWQSIPRVSKTSSCAGTLTTVPLERPLPMVQHVVAGVVPTTIPGLLSEQITDAEAVTAAVNG